MNNKERSSETGSGFKEEWLDEIDESTIVWAKKIANDYEERIVSTSQLRILLSRLSIIKINLQVDNRMMPLLELDAILRDLATKGDEYQEVWMAVKVEINAQEQQDFKLVSQDVELLKPTLHFAGAKGSQKLREFFKIITMEMLPALNKSTKRLQNLIKIVEAITSFHKQPKKSKKR